MMDALALALAMFPASMAAANLCLLGRAAGRPAPGALVSILIPARDEAANIATCLDAALASTGVEIEVLVMDDGSRDATPGIVARRAATDPRLRLLHAPPLPPGWTGKVHACARLAEAARGTHLLFIDADVRLAPDAAARMAAHAQAENLALVTGVPRQRIATLGEGLTVPAINLMMLGYLPGAGRAFTQHPAMAAACGQLILVERGAYESVGGHAAFRHRLHDGLALARNLRIGGHRTEVVDGAPLADCRMYGGFGEAWNGFLKNAREGMATPIGLPVWTLLLAGGHLLPWLLLPSPLAAAALIITYLTRAAITWRGREPSWTIPLHPATVAVALAIQWTALARSALGRPAGWKGRAYRAADGA
ncbi:glycosyltransferase [Roseomonas sp. SSH11]|uniref:Glycosyltransferase n=1 Tax=Pararoseomonas baculiformis TaxID=2820812 RepID=A0ABS4ACP8_9PROT|nr:glycosyltransferase family 2 protein [Pararoseomonas baculiformis]MBP0444325.1 glycosyltransferase [Pararoseomonas baculiformis]